MSFVRRFVVGLSSALLVLCFSVAVRAATLRIETLDVERVDALAPGVGLTFSLFGTPGGRAVLWIEGAQRSLELREVQPGVYDGRYWIDEHDRITPDARVTAMLQLGEREVQATLAERLVLGDEPAPVASLPPREVAPPPPPAPRMLPPAVAPPRARLCDDCALVESIRQVEPEPPSGGLLTSLFGERIGGPVDRHLARITQSVDHAVGRPVARTSHEVVLRLPGGDRLIRSYEHTPPFKVGDTIVLGANLGGARSERLAEPSSSRRAP
ncbi:hypothetical protein HLB44_01295 [Aquincola sp. S2]|uniref:Uncharacterized protein n=1 Tax=Pseudaquabacterium terrae TaxID=2732868 RepID=A0ABX2EB25_9BURK|nr:hypothetical protein [Aquabacterium terrae]NRF65609.1 hypothetical protein [Aquabacterium terrae]